MSNPQRHLVRTHSVTWKVADKAVKDAIAKLGSTASEQAILIEAVRSFDHGEYGNSEDITLPPPDRIQLKNYLNLTAFLLQLMQRIDMGPGVLDWMDEARDFGVRFETMVNPPDEWFEFFFHMILFLQAVFVFVQFLPKYRGTTLVQTGVGYWFFGATMLQLVGSLFQSVLNNAVGSILSSVCMAGMVAAFLRILYIQSQEDVTKHSPEDYWLLRFLWSIQAGWLICVFLTSVNGIFVILEDGAVVQVTIAFISLVIYAFISIKMLFLNGSRPNYVIPGMISVFCFGIFRGFGMPGAEDDLNQVVSMILHGTCLVIAFGVLIATIRLLYQKEYKMVVAESVSTGEGAGYVGGQMDSEGRLSNYV